MGLFKIRRRGCESTVSVEGEREFKKDYMMEQGETEMIQRDHAQEVVDGVRDNIPVAFRGSYDADLMRQLLLQL